MAPIVIAHVPDFAPLLRATKPRTIPAAPNRTGNTNNDKIESAIAAKPMAIAAFFLLYYCYRIPAF